MSDARIRDQLATIMTRPRGEWRALVDREFGQDRALRLQALLWLHSATEAPGDESAPPSLGTSADERYELLLRIDAGASASVWKAYDRRLGRHVAIKVFSELGDSDAVEQVLAEARAASDVVSEHVVRVLDVQYGDGIPYIVMELVSEFDVDRGETVLGASASTTRASSADEVARWVSQVARGVHEAHLRSVFHRDLKPKNVLITPKSRRARVADFGLSVSGASIEATHATMSLIMSGPSGPLSVRG
ncbi:MAG TPA: protein kinase, partial [Kofleriaceae bacterium]